MCVKQLDSVFESCAVNVCSRKPIVIGYQCLCRVYVHTVAQHQVLGKVVAARVHGTVDTVPWLITCNQLAELATVF